MADLPTIAAALMRATDKDVLAAFPAYTRQPLEFELNSLERYLFPTLRVPVETILRWLLRPRSGAVGNLNQSEVDKVYDKEAAGYDAKHHRTTRGQDLMWRRAAGWLVASAPETRPRVLDLCTGTGLTTLEIVRVLAEHDRVADVVGLDYNEAMLGGARRRLQTNSFPSASVSFARGDATNLTGRPVEGFEVFAPASFDIVAQVFGIGGIGDPVAVANEVLSVLREGGRFLLIDMHRPILGLPGELPVPGAWLRIPRYELYSYATTTLPLVLGRLWGWRDPTLDFYLAPLVCHEEEGIHYGFRLIWRIVESERWWFGLPMMPTCRLLLEKVRLDRSEYERRRRVLGLIGAAPSGQAPEVRSQSS